MRENLSWFYVLKISCDGSAQPDNNTLDFSLCVAENTPALHTAKKGFCTRTIITLEKIVDTFYFYVMAGSCIAISIIFRSKNVQK